MRAAKLAALFWLGFLIPVALAAACGWYAPSIDMNERPPAMADTTGK